jgi:alkylation response protein AidB-like acyl-CoA dehydrogenase
MWQKALKVLGTVAPTLAAAIGGPLAGQAVQFLGGMGYMRGTRSERIYREVKVMMIGGGAEEIMKELAAKQLGL